MEFFDVGQPCQYTIEDEYNTGFDLRFNMGLNLLFIFPEGNDYLSETAYKNGSNELRMHYFDGNDYTIQRMKISNE